MNSTELTAFIKEIELNQQEASARNKILKEQKERKRRRMNRNMKGMVALLFASLIVVTIHAMQADIPDNVNVVEAKSLPVEKNLPAERKQAKTEVKAVTEEKTIAKASETAVVKEEAVPKEMATPKEATPKETVQTTTVYNPNIPMPQEHQEYLYGLCKELGLDYKKTLAVVKHESVFDVRAVNATNDYGYFQVNLINHEHLAETLGTANDPLNPYINMEWGTYMLADLYEHWSERGYSGQGLDDAVWSSYNKGLTGFKKYGHATEYIHKMKGAIAYINNQF